MDTTESKLQTIKIRSRRVIPYFRGEHAFLSNFWPATVLIDGQEYPTVEHAYQAAKFDARLKSLAQKRDGSSLTVRQLIQQAPMPALAKKLGKAYAVQQDDHWHEIKLATMRMLVAQKFQNHIDLRAQLMATGDAELVEGNWWDDTFWGQVNGVGLNHLGRILMSVREELRNDGI
jgi:hypothetical protein